MTREGDELSGEEPGYVPPDHRSTAEFRVPGETAADPESTAVDDPVAPAPGPDLAPFSDTPPRDLSDDPPGAPLTTAVDPVDPADPDADADADDAPRPMETPMPPPSPVPMAEEAPWTAQFGAEEEQAPPSPPPSPSPGPPPAALPAPPPPVSPPVPPAAGERTAPASALPSVASPSGGGTGGSGRRSLAVAVVAAVLVLAAAGAAVLLLSGGSDGEGAAPPASSATPVGTPSAAPEGEPTGQPTPVPSGGPTAPPAGREPGAAPTAPTGPAAPAGPLVGGDGVTYQLVQRDEGYHEGRLVITNRTGRPMTSWHLTFNVPGADVRNIWGGRLVRGGAEVELTNLDGAAAIPPGGEWEVRFGARGAATTPEQCEINGRACGF